MMRSAGFPFSAALVTNPARRLWPLKSVAPSPARLALLTELLGSLGICGRNAATGWASFSRHSKYYGRPFVPQNARERMRCRGRRHRESVSRVETLGAKLAALWLHIAARTGCRTKTATLQVPATSPKNLGGAGGDRTPDPQTASLMLSQLSYSPNLWSARPLGEPLTRLEATGEALGCQSVAGDLVCWRGVRRSGETGIRRALKRPRLHGRVGSNPTSGTSLRARRERVRESSNPNLQIWIW